jgi:hypothetical protein
MPREQLPPGRGVGGAAYRATFNPNRWYGTTTRNHRQADSASPRFVAARSASRGPPLIVPPRHTASGVELLAGDSEPPVRR